MICVNSVSVSPGSITIKKGSWYYGASATVCPTNADCTDVTWHSSNSSVASVNASSGYICANAVGTARIYATATDGSGCSDYITVTVTNTVSVSSVTLNRTAASIEVGSSITLGATVCPENATNRSVNWSSSNSSVASVSGGVVCALAQGSARITATAADGSGKSASCTITVTGATLVNSICISPDTRTMITGKSAYFYATVCPENADNRCVTWSSSNTGVASVNSVSGLVYAHNAGNAIIYATAQDGSGCVGCCQVTVASVAVSSITVSPEHCTLSIDETKTLYASICPSNASNKSIVWSSSDTSVASVGRYTGIVTAISDGVVTITARSVSGNKTDTCTVVVDSRERVQVKKDSHSFYVEFEDGKIWKNIGIDLSKRQDNYNALYPPNFWYENYEDLIEEEQRYFDNIYIEDVEIGEPIVEETYSAKQIAFLYLLDPLGIEYYMRTNACHDMSLGEALFFKDRVYKEIFGVWPRLIKVFPDKTIQYYVYAPSISDEMRADYYTDAEILFGEHPIYDLLSLISFLLDVVPSVSLSLFSIFYPPAGVVLGSIDLVKFLFFSASASSVLSSGVNSIMEEYTSSVYALSNGESAGVKAGKAMGWVNFVLGTFSTILDATAVFTPSVNDITIYNRVSESDYRVNYRVDNSELSMEDIISRIS